MMLRCLFVTVLGLLTVMPAPPASACQTVDEHAGGSYRIGAEDVLEIIVWNNAPLSRTVAVRPDGMISLPLINDVPAAGLTPLEIRELVRTKLADFIEAPEVSTIVKEIRSSRVSLVGEVKTPGRYELKGRTTVLELIAWAGGLTEFGSRTRIVILRGSGSATQRIPFNYNKALAANGAQANILLEPGDVVVVP
ncbi:MAG: sugar ABC transporter substrate-binding protein [Candidatus Rokuibacteriota bacterium]|nr:MAG: sugar ABC transporter substrate-binding protein [Candidatus Rokubacteria bacterium]